jgi:hypothetical protein
VADQTQLRQQEAVQLAHALVARLAERSGARVLFIKGPTAIAVGARPDRPSSDVDVLVDPAAFDALCEAIEACGWQLRTEPRRDKAIALAFEHSAHYIHPEWPIDLDVHYLFPGFFAPPDHVFEALWERPTEVEIAGCRVPTTDLLGQALVVGLHALRDPTRSASVDDLNHLARALAGLSPEDRRHLVGLAQRTGSSGSAADLLSRVGLSPAELSEEERRRLVDWQVRAAGLGRSTIWLAQLQEAGWRDRPRVLRRALLPPPEHFLPSHVAADVSRVSLAGLHLRRWGRGLVALPHAVLVLARRRGASRSQ